MNNELKEAAAILGKCGGEAGTGDSKVRGDSAYYRTLSRKRLRKQRRQQRKNGK